MDDLDQGAILEGLTGEIDDYSAKKIGMPGKGVSITISMDKGEGDDTEDAPGGCSGCSMHCGGKV